MTNQEILMLKNKGYVILRNKVTPEWISKLSKGIDNAFIEHQKTQIKNKNDIKTSGVALHALLSDNIFIDFLDYLINIGFIDELKGKYFKSNCILNSLSALDNIPNQPNFSSVVIIFDSNVWHSSALNTTQSSRKAIPITISRSFMKQLLDYPRAIGYDKMDNFNDDLQQFLGYHSRVPASLNEWYQPQSNRFYKQNQD